MHPNKDENDDDEYGSGYMCNAHIHIVHMQMVTIWKQPIKEQEKHIKHSSSHESTNLI